MTGGRSWDYINTIPLGQFYEISLDNRKPYWIYGGLQDNGSWAGPSATYNQEGGDQRRVVSHRRRRRVLRAGGPSRPRHTLRRIAETEMSRGLSLRRASANLFGPSRARARSLPLRLELAHSHFAAQQPHHLLRWQPRISLDGPWRFVDREPGPYARPGPR